MARITMESFEKRFRKETHFKKPLSRDWTVKAFETHLKRQMAEWGGEITKSTSVRQYELIISSYESLWVTWTNTLLRTDTAVKNGMFAAMGIAVGAQQGMGAGFIFFTKDPCSDVVDPALQAEFNLMSPQEQDRCDYLQKLCTSFHCYHSDKIVDAKIWAGIRDALQKERSRVPPQTLSWAQVKTHIKKHLRDVDAKYLLDAQASIVRQDKSELLTWLLFMKNLKDMSTKAGFVLPPRLWCTLLLGQISGNERSSGKFDLPKNDAECDLFVYGPLEAAVRALAPGTLKEFRASHVTEYTRTLLVHREDRVKALRNESDTRDTMRHCKWCKMKHPQGKHNAAGKEAISEANKARNAGSDTPPRNPKKGNRARAADTQNGKAADKAAAARKKTCIKCKKVHWPLCRLP